MYRLMVIVCAVALPMSGQKPIIFDVSAVTIGTQGLETEWAWAQGKWSDAGPKVGGPSADIHCYKRFSFCEAAEAFVIGGDAVLRTETFDVLRWDASEIIAVDSAPVCVVNTLRFDLAAKRVSISSASKHELTIPVCKQLEPTATTTAFLAR